MEPRRGEQAEMTETTLTWSISNWITVLLMVVVGYAIAGAVAQAYLNASKKA